MGSPSEESFTEIYRRYFSPDEDAAEEEAVTSACTFVLQTFEHIRPPPPPRPILRRTYILRDREAANERLMKDYFDAAPVHGPNVFRRRFRMSQRLFLRINNDLENTYDFFKQRMDARGYLGFTSIQKVTSALRVLAYGNTYDINDEYLKMAEKTTRDTLEHFCYGICQLYGKCYLRNPTWNDLQKIYEVHLEKHGIPGMIGSLDCRQWRWYNCPTAWRGQHTRGDQKGPTLVLQGVASYDLWVWSAFFGVAGCFNDINTLEASPLIEGYISGTIPKAGFHANGNDYEHGYYLGDGIYPEYSIIVKTFSETFDEKRKYFKKLQESSRKDIERCFGVLQQRWHFIRNPCRMWHKDKIRMAMYACIILHNMIIEDDGKAICQNYIPEDLVELPQATTEERLANAQLLRSREIHNTLKADLVEHAWAIRPIRSNNDHDEDSEEEVGEEFEDGNFEDVGLDAGENEEEEGENEDDTEE
ncbi:uncharacterized protein LOC110891285 [Helianthus annuus]|uniref:uncharacterized protein LOC110891285 n=1 Tax=Helianthus annuus TaxID=4232 RepID=UPI000B904CBB|nr:uncharacterized protein LOC110891285 [Helianthus annuus]KAJ0519268.1 putative harbinger transposase-derived protein [Helianthus annuus]